MMQTSERSVSTRIRLLLTVLILAAVMMTGGLLCGQQSNGAITGLVVDSKNSVIVGARVTVSGDDGTFKTDTVTSSAGVYSVSSLPPGNYTVHIETSGFRPYIIKQVPVSVGSVETVDATLKVGEATATITVMSTDTLLTPSSPTLHTTIDQAMTIDLPFSERTSLGVAMLAPGVTGDPQASDGVGSELPNAYTGAIDPGAAIGIAGSRPGAVSQLVDGSDLLLMSYPRAGVSFSGDAIRSVTVESAGLEAQYGRTGGGIINQASSAGTDRYHGVLRWRHRDPTMELVVRHSGGAAPAEHMNLFTIAAGGPVPIPWIKKRTFFFVAFEPLRDTNISWNRKRFMTPDEIAGRFANSYDELNTTILKNQGYAAAVAAPRTGGQFYDFPLDTNGFPCGKVDAACVAPTSNLGKYSSTVNNVRVPNDDLSALQAKNPISQWIFNSQPQPSQNSPYAHFDNPQATYDNVGNNGYGARGVQVIDNRYTFRIDENATDRDRVYFRYTTTPVSGLRYDTQGPNNPLEDIPHESVNSQNVALNYVRIISSNMVNEVRATFIQSNDTQSPIPASLTKDWNAAVGLPAAKAGVGAASFTGNNNIGQVGYSNLLAYINESYGFGDDFSIQHGRHTLKFGINYRAMQLNTHSFTGYYGGAYTGSTNNVSGQANSNGQPCTGQSGGTGACQTFSGSVLASYVLGTIGTYTVYAPKTYYYRWKYGAAYVQDSWRASNRLTLNLGLRWQVETPRMEKYDYQGSFIPNGAGVLNGVGVTGGFAYSGTNGLPNTLWPMNYVQFEPRIGFAYQSKSFMTIRGAYTLVHAPLTGLGVNIAPNLTSASAASVGSSGVGGTDSRFYVNLISNPINTALLNPSVPVRSTALLESWNGTTYLPYVRDQSKSVPYVQLWSLSLQFQLSKGTLLEADYVGQKGTHLYSTPVPTNDVPIGSDTTPNTVRWDIATHQVLTTTTTDKYGNNTTLLQQQRPYPQFNSNPIWSAYDRYAASNYNALYLTGRQQAAYGLTFIGSFSWSKSMDNASSSVGAPGDAQLDTYGFAYPQGYDINGDYSLSTFDIPVHLSTGYVWQIPIGRGQKFFAKTPRWADEIIGGWSTSGTQIFQSGYPLYIIASSNRTTSGYFCSTATTSGAAVCGLGSALNDVYLRPNRVPGVRAINPNWKKDPYGATSTGGILNSAAWSMPGSPSDPQFGNARRTSGDVRDPRAIFWNASIRKRFTVVPSRLNSEIYCDITNIMNHTNYLIQGNNPTNQGVFTNTLTAGSYSVNPSFGIANSGAQMRSINLGIALIF